MPRWVVANEDEEENESSEEESEEEEQQEEADNDDRDAAGPSCTREAEEEDVTARAGGLKKKITIPLGRGGLVCHVRACIYGNTLSVHVEVIGMQSRRYLFTRLLSAGLWRDRAQCRLYRLRLHGLPKQAVLPVQEGRAYNHDLPLSVRQPRA